MKIYAHRGFSYKYPEATRAAYLGAIEVGADGFECDVRLTKDGIPVCFHDRDTKRIAGVKKRIAALTLAQLREFIEVLTLEELLQLAKTNRKKVLVETKHPVLSGGRIEKSVIELSRSYELTAMSFSLLAVLRLMRDLDDVVYVIAHRWRLLYLPTNKVAINLELFERSKWTRKRLKGREVLIWTVNEERYIPKLKEWGVSAVITDRPDLPFRLS
ncbi:MAG: glycerophosphodiester phosphodiesterase [Actinobacteria bacterium]|nr:glycerophosphodiester phosphodiesterase [Actinomycetota bacterium]